MAAATGSGKTFAYTLPTVQNLQNQELLGYKRQIQRPRCLILVPTRDLARQVLQSVKQIGHFSKVSSAAVIGGEDYSLQKKAVC
jgi:superfamily II DNA/RNA helicase